VCRHLAYLGAPRAIRELVTDPEFGLVRQAYAPRRQRHGTINADGFGVGWYAEAPAAPATGAHPAVAAPARAAPACIGSAIGSAVVDPIPARYRRAVPIWTDAGLPDLARVVRTHALLAAVRDGTPGFPYTEHACAPFAAGRVLFSHNGALPGGAPALAALAAGLDPVELVALESPTDSAVLWALVRRRLAAGDPLPTAISSVFATTTRPGPARPHPTSPPTTGPPTTNPPTTSPPTTNLASAHGWRNLLATDGEVIVAVADGDSLSWRALDGGVVVASEPYDDDPAWQDVPDRHLLVATRDGVRVTPLDTDDTRQEPQAWEISGSTTTCPTTT
jgi:glutamine amidotransferase